MKNWTGRLAEWWKNKIGNKSTKSEPTNEKQVDLDKLFKSKEYIESIEKFKNPEKPDIDKMFTENNPNIVVEVNMYLNVICAYGEDLSKLNDSQRYLYLSQTVYDEVNNGGFAQYFSNSSGDYAHESIEALIQIGDQKAAELLRKAIDQFPGSIIPKDRDERNVIIDKISEKADSAWFKLDDKFYDCGCGEDSISLQFIKNNINDFRFN